MVCAVCKWRNKCCNVKHNSQCPILPDKPSEQNNFTPYGSTLFAGIDNNIIHIISRTTMKQSLGQVQETKAYQLPGYQRHRHKQHQDNPRALYYSTSSTVSTLPIDQVNRSDPFRLQSNLFNRSKSFRWLYY